MFVPAIFHLQVVTNGFFSFGNAITDFSPSLFPAEHNYLVAPFWADVNIAGGNGGEILYEVHSGSNARIDEVSRFVSQQFSTTFQGQWMLITEWKEVPPFGGTDVSSFSDCM